MRSVRRGLSFRAALLPSLFLHGLVVGLLLLAVHRRPAAPRGRSPVEMIDVALQVDIMTSSVEESAVGTIAAEPADSPTRLTAKRVRVSTSQSSASVVASSTPTASSNESVSAAPGGSSPAAAGPPSPTRKHLSLEALGLTPGAHAAWDLTTTPLPTRAQRRQEQLRASEQRLARSMHQQVIDYDSSAPAV
jgi:hypothetical protein